MEHRPVSRSFERYDVYMFGNASDVLVGWHKFEANNEAAAISVAIALAQSQRMELWHGDILVRSWSRPK